MLSLQVTVCVVTLLRYIPLPRKMQHGIFHDDDGQVAQTHSIDYAYIPMVHNLLGNLQSCH